MATTICQYGHYYKHFKLQGLKKVTVTDILEDGSYKVVFGHRTPKQAEGCGKMYCGHDQLITELPADVLAQLEAEEAKRAAEKAEEKRKQIAEQEAREERILDFVGRMIDLGVPMDTATASWLTEEQMEKMIEACSKEVDDEFPLIM